MTTFQNNVIDDYSTVIVKDKASQVEVRFTTQHSLIHCGTIFHLHAAERASRGSLKP